MIKNIKHKRGMTEGRVFFTKKDMAVSKMDEAIANSRTKREGKQVCGVYQFHCGCGEEGCWITITKEKSNAKLVKKQKCPTKHPKRRESLMFGGKII